LISGETVYLQVIIDNFSRYIVNWKLTSKISLKNTFDLVKDTAKSDSKKTQLISDQGPENKTLSKFEHKFSKNISFILARLDIKQSNSMVEAFFKSLKNNYLYKKKLKTIADARRCINFYIEQHNKNPVLLFKGASPDEIYKSSWSQDKIEDLAKNKTKAINKRKANETIKKCRSCYL